MPNTAPTDELIRYLCLFHRFLVYLEDCITAQDRDGVVLSTYAADALHNVPRMLSYYTLDDPWNEPARIAYWIQQFPAVVRHSEAPDRIAEDCDRMFSPDGANDELNLKEDLSNLDLAPPDQIAHNLNHLYEFCITIRWRSLYPWKKEYSRWQDWEPEYSAVVQAFAATLKEVPIGMVHWHQFDQETFSKTMTDLNKRMHEVCMHDQTPTSGRPAGDTQGHSE